MPGSLKSCTGPEDLRARWADATERAVIIEQLAGRGVDFQTVATKAGKPDADTFDLLCHLAFNAPVFTRRQRADQFNRQKPALLAYYAPEVSGLPNVLKVPQISKRGNSNEIMRRCGGVRWRRQPPHGCN